MRSRWRTVQNKGITLRFSCSLSQSSLKNIFIDTYKNSIVTTALFYWKPESSPSWKASTKLNFDGFFVSVNRRPFLWQIWLYKKYLAFINSSGQIRLKKTIYIFYNINTNETPGFLSHGIMIESSSHVKVTWFLHTWKDHHNKLHLLQPNNIKVKWISISLVFM